VHVIDRLLIQTDNAYAYERRGVHMRGGMVLRVLHRHAQDTIKVNVAC
jgi:hypothetical protein